MSFQLVSDRLTEISNALDESMPAVIAQQIMVELSAIHKKRIFGDGLNSENKPIGRYKTDEAYFSKKEFIRQAAFKPQGKPKSDGTKREGKFKNGNDRKSMFIATGYAGFRDIQGRDGMNINLKYSGSLESSMQTMKLGNAALYGILDKNEWIKFEALQEKLKALYLSENEKNFLINEIDIESQNNIPPAK